VPNLTYKEHFDLHGVDSLFSQQAYDTAYNKNMAFLIHRLNKGTSGTDYEHSTPKDLILTFARNPTYASLFSAASMAHNTHFFFDSLAPIPNPLNKYEVLESALIKSFGSIDSLLRTMLTTANAMHGPGFVWLVQATRRSTSAAGVPSSLPEFRILTTYNAGTPYPEAMYRQQSKDQSTELGYNGNAGSFGSTSAREKDAPQLPPGTELITPVLCVSTWEHMYLQDYGVDKKSTYLVDWWKVIDWAAVDNRRLKHQNLGSITQSAFDKQS
jgi:Fe-Mn family superoxide dismutase